MATWLQQSDFLLYSPRYTNADSLTLLRDYQGADRFVFVRSVSASSLPFCLASSLCTMKNIYLTIRSSFKYYCSLKKTRNKGNMLDMQVKLTTIPTYYVLEDRYI